MEFFLDKIEIFFLIFIRVVTLVALIPIFGYRGVPIQVKAGFSLVLTFILFPLVKPTVTDIHLGLIPYLVLIAKEVAAGVVIGFATQLIFVGVQFAGQVVGFQMGFGIVNVLDPWSGTQVSIIGQFNHLLAMLIFLTLDGHHFLLAALSKSFELIPLMGVSFSQLLGTHLIRMTAEVFEIGIKIGAPVIVALTLTTVAMSILARTVPQMNIFIVGFPVKIGVGLAVLAFSMPLFLYVFKKLYIQFQSDISTILKLLY